jgi:hypothetical protein
MPRLANPPKPREKLAPLWFAPRQAAELLNKSVAQLYQEMREGTTPYLMDGNARRIPASHIKERTKYPPDTS